jgi:hypothetical protein
VDDIDINAAGLNGAGQGGVATGAVVDGRVFALMSGGGRVISRNRTDGSVQAILSGGGRVVARNATDARIEFAGTGSRTSVVRRSVVDGFAQVSGAARASIYVRSPNTYTARVDGTAIARVARRAPMSVGVTLAATARARALRRSPVAAVVSVMGESIGTIIPRREVRHLMDAEVRVDGVAILRGLISVRVDGRVLVRLDGSGGGIGNQFPFDEPAPPERRFTAPQRPPTFTVTEMALVGTATQQPSDIYDYDVDFSSWFPPGDTIIVATVVASPTMPVDPSTAINGQTVKVWVYDGGTSGLTYTLTLLAITSDGRQKEVELRVKIKEE